MDCSSQRSSMEDLRTLGYVDYIVFSLTLLFPVAVGLYYHFTGGRQRTTKEYLLADHNMSILPVAFSLMASFMSAITLLGVSSENYVYGTQFVVINIAYAIGTPIAAFIFLPVFFQIRCTSAYEYLERRFGLPTRLMSSVTFMLQMVLYVALVLYAPCLALSAVTGLPKLWSVIMLGAVCTVYSTIGGIKTVLWTDLFQSCIMFLSVITVAVKGTIQVGGLGNVWSIAQEGGRIQFDNFDPDPTVRHTVWTLVIGGIFTYTSIYGVNQAQVQRLLTVKTLRHSQIALFLNWPVLSLLSLSTSFMGLVMYANFYGCDPLLRPQQTHVTKNDQLLPYFVMTFQSLPGFAGLFVAGIFSAALSTMSSAINSLTAVTLEDFIKPFCFRGGIDATKEILISKLTAMTFGILCIGMAFVAEQLGSLLQASLTIFGVVGGPLLGLFTLGMLFPKANQKGALAGLSVSLALCLCIGFGANVNSFPAKPLPLSTEKCPKMNETINIPFTTLPTMARAVANETGFLSSDMYLSNETMINSTSDRYIFPLYKLSYMWHCGVGWLTALLVGIIISLITGGNTSVDPLLFSPVIRCWSGDYGEYVLSVYEKEPHLTSANPDKWTDDQCVQKLNKDGFQKIESPC